MAAGPGSGANSSVILRLLSTGQDSPLDMRFVLTPLQSTRWDEAFRAAAAADSSTPPRLERSTRGVEYVIHWDEGPQDVDVALQRLDEYIAEADATLDRRPAR